jgi:hypothetical protein
MAQSGSRDWTTVTTNIILRALRIVGVPFPEINQVVYAKQALNDMVNSWQAENIFLWTLEWTTKTFSAASEVVGDNDGLNYTCRKGHTSSAADRPDSGANHTTYWEQTGSSGGAWAASTAYSAIGDFAPGTEVISIDKAFIRRNDRDHEVEIITKDEYADIPDKHDTSRPLKLYFEKGLTPTVFLWPQPENTTDVLHYWKVQILQDFDSSDDNPDFPVYWIEALVFGLAETLSYEYPELPVDRLRMIIRKAEVLMSRAKASNLEYYTDKHVESAYPQG